MAITMKITPRKLSIKDFKILKTLGSGGFGTCKKALYKNHIVCIKQINETSKREAAKQSFQAETKTEFFTFQHENIVKLLAVSQPASFENLVKTNELFMIFEYIEGRNLQLLIDDENEDINLKRMCRFGSDIASALSYVHAYGIVHLDLKPANIMVTQGDVCKLADFGCSQYLNETSTPRSLLTGTCAYRAPELYKAKSPSAKCDIYALGKFLCKPFITFFFSVKYEPLINLRVLTNTVTKIL